MNLTPIPDTHFVATDTLMRVMKEAPLHISETLLGMIEQYKHQLLKPISDGVPLKDILESIWDFIDQEYAREVPKSGRTISCRAGCAHCCRINVTITEAEAIVIMDFLEEHGIPLDAAYLKSQVRLGEMPHEKRGDLAPCVFLSSDNLCSIYPVRPIACRKYQVASDPDLCDLQKHGSAEKNIEIVYCLQNEALASGVLAVGMETGSLPQILLSEYNKRVEHVKQQRSIQKVQVHHLPAE